MVIFEYLSGLNLKVNINLRRIGPCEYCTCIFWFLSTFIEILFLLPTGHSDLNTAPAVGRIPIQLILYCLSFHWIYRKNILQSYTKTFTLPGYRHLFLRIFWLMDFPNIFDFKFSPLLIRVKTISLMFESDIMSPSSGVCLPDIQIYNIYLLLFVYEEQYYLGKMSPSMCIEKCLSERVLKCVTQNAY